MVAAEQGGHDAAALLRPSAGEAAAVPHPPAEQGRTRRARRRGADATPDECDWDWRMTGGAQLSVGKIEA